jgi:release factor glutamine methyltransferase
MKIEYPMKRSDYLEYINIRNLILIEHLANHQDEVEIIFDKYSLILSPGVFNPLLGEGSLLMSYCKNHMFGSNVLEIGTGTGALSILASEQSKRIIATDISPLAVDCARKNVKRLNLEYFIEVRQGDLFEPVKGEKFDKIIFNPPFIEGQSKSFIENSYYDCNYETLTKFFNNAKNYLTVDGAIILCFGSVGDINYLNWLITANHFNVQFITNRLMNNLQFFVYKIW